RLSAGYNQIVDTHGDQVNTDSVVLAKLHGQAQFGAYTVGAGDDNRFTVTCRNLAQGSKTAQSRHYFRPPGAAGNPLTTFDEGFARIHITTGVFITSRWSGRLFAHRGWAAQAS